MKVELTEPEMQTLLAALVITIGGDNALLDDLDCDSSWRIPLTGRRTRMADLEKRLRSEYEAQTR